jgi:hypothetical protein
MENDTIKKLNGYYEWQMKRSFNERLGKLVAKMKMDEIISRIPLVDSPNYTLADLCFLQLSTADLAILREYQTSVSKSNRGPNI